MNRWQKTVAVDADPAQRRTATRQDHVSRQVCVLTPQSVVHPRSGAGIPRLRKSRVDEVVSLSMLVGDAGHRTNDREVIGTLCDVWKEIAHGQPTLTVVFELPRAGHDVAVGVEHCRLDRDGHRLAVVELQTRLRVERIDMRHASRHEAKDDALRARRQGAAWVKRGSVFRGEQAWPMRRQQSGQRRQTKANGAASEHVAASDRNPIA